MRVLIVAKTRVRNGACIGAISTTGQSLRLIPDGGYPDGAFNLEYEIGDVWELDDYEFPDDSDVVPPHVENVIVRRKRFDRRYDNPTSIIEQSMPPQRGGVDVLYDGLTRTSRSGSLFVSERTGVPAYSTMFWRPEQPLVLDDNGMRLHYRYLSANGGAKLAYVGFQDPLAEIPAGSLVRVSLAHWWRPDDAEQMEPRCYCQLSGWFDTGLCRGVDLTGLLRSIFGYEEFRDPQETLICGLLEGKDALAIMPTGGGKSLCYQLAAVALEGVAVVVSPLIALMQDQVDALTALGIPATFLNSTLDYAAYVERQRLVRENQVRLLYVAPETLARPETIYMLQNSKMTLLAIDEAHCISEWGHDFRPDYRQLGDIRSRLPDVPCIALTATATPRVQRDIVKHLGIDAERIHVGDLDRKNLFLEVRSRSGDGVDQVADFIDAHKGQSGIVYCATRAGVDDLCAALTARGVAALPYHAGLQDDVRLHNQTRFIRDDADVMVATIAFGMGIDKSNIRFVVHHNLPDCLDKYYQQIGRAGRDGLRADCLLLHGPADLRTIDYHISHMSPVERPGAKYRLEQIQSWMASQSCRRIGLIEYFGQKHTKSDCGMCDRCVETKTVVSGDDDLTREARLFLSCMIQTRQSFGKGQIIDVLRGSRSQKVLQNRHDQLPSYGKGSALDKRKWLVLADQLIDRGLVRVGEYYVLSITEQGQRVLDGESFLGQAPASGRRTSLSSRVSARGELKYDADLFEKLRALRKSLADEANLPAYTIFHDSTLREMAAFMPTTLDEFRDIRGVGEAKAENYGAQFLAAIAEHRTDETTPRTQATHTPYGGGEIEAPELRPRTRQVVACYLETQSLAEAGSQLDIAPSTVAGHLERYIDAGYDIPLEPIIAESAVSAADAAQVFDLFNELGTNELKPIFEHFLGEISYLELRILLLWYRIAADHPKTHTHMTDASNA